MNVNVTTIDIGLVDPVATVRGERENGQEGVHEKENEVVTENGIE